MDDFILNGLLVLGFAAFMVSPQMRDRRGLLLCNFAGCCLHAVYYAAMGADAAFYACLIAASSSLLQAMIPAQRMDETRFVRTGIAIVMALLAMFLCLHNT